MALYFNRSLTKVINMFARPVTVFCLRDKTDGKLHRQCVVVARVIAFNTLSSETSSASKMFFWRGATGASDTVLVTFIEKTIRRPIRCVRDQIRFSRV